MEETGFESSVIAWKYIELAGSQLQIRVIRVRFGGALTQISLTRRYLFSKAWSITTRMPMCCGNYQIA